ncbi:MAG: peptidylprolyl isomerase [Acidobacteriota bacterium]
MIFVMRCLLASLLIIALAAVSVADRQKKKKAAAPEAPLSVEEMSALEAVITTDLGAIRFEFFPEKAPNHCRHFIRLARQGFYDGSAFHRVIAHAIIQGGAPLLKDQRTPRERWGPGALSQVADELSDIKHTRGVVSTARIPGRANSGGAQFFICVSPQPSLDAQFSAFGQVTEGIDIVEKISLVQTDANQLTASPVKIISVKIEPKKTEPFKDASIDQLIKDVLLRTTLGDITVELDPEIAPEHARNFLKLVETGWYDHTAFHRIIPGFVIQGGIGSTRAGGGAHAADRWVRKLKGEFSNRPHLRGVLSMARADDPDSADTSFFIVLGAAPHLDSKYTVFGKVIDGFDVLDRIEKVQRQGERPLERIELIEAAIKP